MVSGWPAAVMHPNHWHCPVVVYTPTEYGGRDDDYYVYECEDPACLVDAEWWTPEYFARLWGRND
jgi:hypothetical protein